MQKKTIQKDMSAFGQDLIPSLFGSINRFDMFPTTESVFADIYKTMDRAWKDFNISNYVFDEFQSHTKFPKINVAETEGEYEIEIAVSGFNKEDVELEFRDSCLFIKAEKSKSTEDVTKKYLTKEISTKSFRRFVRLPSKVDEKNITCNYNETNGLITCTLPKQSLMNPDTVKITIN